MKTTLKMLFVPLMELKLIQRGWLFKWRGPEEELLDLQILIEAFLRLTLTIALFSLTCLAPCLGKTLKIFANNMRLVQYLLMFSVSEECIEGWRNFAPVKI